MLARSPGILTVRGCVYQYNNNVHFEGVRFICGPHLAIIGPRESKGRFNGKVRAANESYALKMNIITIITHFCEFTST